MPPHRRSRTTFATIDAAAIAALFVSPSTTAVCSGADGPSRKPSTRHASAGGASVVQDRAHRVEVRAVQPAAVDLAGRDRHGRRTARRTPTTRAVQLLALGRARPASSRSAYASGRTRWSRSTRSRAGRRRRRAGRRASRGRPRRCRRRTARRASVEPEELLARPAHDERGTAPSCARAGSSVSASALGFFCCGLGLFGCGLLVGDGLLGLLLGLDGSRRPFGLSPASTRLGSLGRG